MQARREEDLDEDEDSRTFEKERKTVGQERSQRVEERSPRCSSVRQQEYLGLGEKEFVLLLTETAVM